MKDLIQSLSDLDSDKSVSTKKKDDCDTGNMTLIKQLNESSASVKQYNRIEENYRKFKMRENMAMNQQNFASTDDVGVTDDGQVTPQQAQQLKAQQLKSLADQKKQVQDQIRQTEKLLVDLRKKLTDLNNPANVSMGMVSENELRKDTGKNNPASKGSKVSSNSAKAKSAFKKD